MPSNLDRFYAISLAVGAAINLSQLALSDWNIAALNLLARGLLMLPLIAAIFVCMRLWRGTQDGYKWGAILFALQTFWLTVPGISYSWFTGLLAGVRMVYSAEGFRAGIVGSAGGEIYLLVVQTNAIVVGLNVFALIAAIYLSHAYDKTKAIATAGA